MPGIRETTRFLTVAKRRSIFHGAYVASNGPEGDAHYMHGLTECPVLADSSGHSHGGNRPMGTYRYPTNSTTAKDTILAKTDSLGKIKFRYVASQFGGVERIRARLVSDTTKFDTLSIKTRVPGLVLLPEGTKYLKVGGTCKHHGPDTVAACATPDNNHWGTNRLVQAIQAIADKYDSLHRRVRLRVNDLSLPYGGLFDVSGNWRPNHKEHRIGINADYSLVCRDSLNNPVGLNEKDFKGIVKKKTDIEPYRHRPPDPPHYHVYVKED